MPLLSPTLRLVSERRQAAYSTPILLSLTERGVLLEGATLTNVVNTGTVRIRRSYLARTAAVTGLGTLAEYTDPAGKFNASYVGDAADPDVPGMYIVEVDIVGGLTYPDGSEHNWLRIIEDVG